LAGCRAAQSLEHVSAAGLDASDGCPNPIHLCSKMRIPLVALKDSVPLDLDGHLFSGMLGQGEWPVALQDTPDRDWKE
jgi:hypothetical protein